MSVGFNYAEEGLTLTCASAYSSRSNNHQRIDFMVGWEKQVCTIKEKKRKFRGSNVKHQNPKIDEALW